jgi:hypothetical protein
MGREFGPLELSLHLIFITVKPALPFPELLRRDDCLPKLEDNQTIPTTIP